jgi:hypothetical protein
MNYVNLVQGIADLLTDEQIERWKIARLVVEQDQQSWEDDGGAMVGEEMFAKEPRARLLKEMTTTYKWRGKSDHMSTSSYPHHSEQEAVADAIGQAIRHAKRVSKRDHIKADRIERVNQFVVSLRTRLLSFRSGISHTNELVADLCDKTIWYDIGELGSQQASGRYNKMSNIQIQRLLDIAKSRANVADAQSEEILGDLEELERGLHGIRLVNEEADRINQEGEKLVEDLCTVFSDE